jgi:hypothetical protein
MAGNSRQLSDWVGEADVKWDWGGHLARCFCIPWRMRQQTNMWSEWRKPPFLRPGSCPVPLTNRAAVGPKHSSWQPAVSQSRQRRVCAFQALRLLIG